MVKKKSYIVWYFILLTLISALEVVTTIFNGKFITVLEKQSDMDVVIRFMALFFGAIVLTIILNYFYEILISKYIESNKFIKKSTVIENLRRSDAKTFRNIDSSYIAMRLDGDMENIMAFKLRQFYPSIFKAIKIVVMMGIVYTIDKQVFLFLLAGIPIMYFIYRLSKKKITVVANDMMDTDAKYFSAFESGVQNLTEVVESGNYEKINSRFDNIFLRAYHAYMKYVGYDAGFDSIINLVMFGMQIVIMLFAGYKVFTGTIFLGDMSNLFQFSTAILVSVMMLTGIGKDYRKVKASEDKLNEYENIKRLPEGKMSVDDLESVKYDITFGFDNNLLYKDFKGEFKKENIYLLNASNGKGKTTFYKLMTGVLKDDNAKIYVDNINLADIDSIEFRKDLTDVVFQTPRTRTNTPAEYFNSKFKISSSHELIDKLNERNINTEIIEDVLEGTWSKAFKDISGGERQLIFIVSALLNDKKIQIYDEPTSNLDISKKEWFKDEVAKAKVGNIIIIISHDGDIKSVADSVVSF